ncbi:MAG: hypothetical protein IJU68_02575 [Bacteroidales bacterium]|nr:hypothetical protein [Bacteroidales bacterium]
MKKILCAVALLLGMSAMFVSCDKDNPADYSKNIVGTWNVEKTEYYHNGELVHTEPGTVQTVFTAEGKFYTTEASAIQGDYTISGDKITMSFILNFTATILKLSTTEMQLEQTGDGVLSQITYDKLITYYKKAK